MANRVVYGHSWSSNGWPMVDQGSCTWVKVPGTNVSLQIQNGWPLVVLRAFAADFHAYIEPLRDADSACWTGTNSVSTSNHLSGTAMDLNWDSHPFRIPDAGFDAAKLARLRELLDFYEGIVFWGNDWSNPKDAMHFQLASLANGGRFNTYNNPLVGDFILRKIRPDGFSTFRRGDTPTPAASDPAWVLAKATGLSIDRARVILPAVRDGLVASKATTAPRIAMWLAQVGHESASFVYTEEIAKNGRYAPYIGRTWIQITWDYNYRAFSKWCFDRGLVPTSDYFVRDYLALAQLKWAGLGAAWYWTEARGTKINDAADRRDLVTATRLINGGTNGLSDRQTRYNLANTLGVLLLNLIDTSSGDDMAQVPQEQWDRVFRELTQLHESKSGYRTPNEGFIGTWCTVDRNDDQMLHEMFTEWKAIQFGDVDSIYRILRSSVGLGADTSPSFIQNSKRALSKIPTNYLEPALALIEAEDPGVLRAFISQNGSK